MFSISLCSSAYQSYGNDQLIVGMEATTMGVHFVFIKAQ